MSALTSIVRGKKQWELARIKEVLFEEFDNAMAHSSSPWRKNARIQSLILLGSYARGDWVYEPQTTKAYKSDYDLLVIVSHRKITEMTELWYDLDQKLLRDKTIKAPVTFIIHTLKEVNDALSKGQYFFMDIKREGIVLHQRPNIRLTEPKDLSAQEAYDVAKEHFEERFSDANEFVIDFKASIERKSYKHAAFLMHQATEHAYSALLLTQTGYSPSTHRITALHSFAKDLDERLLDVWPDDEKQHRQWFTKLVDAYVKARYSKHYTITEEALTWLSERVTHLHKQVNEICTEHLTKLEEAAKAEK